MQITATALRSVIFAAFLCFLLGFIVQVLFHLVPANSPASTAAIPIHAHNHFYIDGKVYDINGEDIANIAQGGHVSLRAGSNKHGPPVSGKSVGKSILSANSPSSAEEMRLSDSVDTDSSLFADEAKDNVPSIVRAWRNAKLDWHQLLPTHNSLWERFGTPQKEGKLRLLVSKEMMVTDYLTRYHESGLSGKYGHDHGALKEYSGCNRFASSCMIHDQKTCQEDDFCSWSTQRDLCVTATDADVYEAVKSNPKQQQECPDPKHVTDRGFVAVADRSWCKVWSHQPSVQVSIDSESQSMFYHWWASWGGMLKYWRDQLSQRRDVHFFLSAINDPMFFQFFGLLSDNCWQRTQASSMEGICLCEAKQTRTSQSHSLGEYSSNQMIDFLSLSEVKPPADKVKVGLISRRRKRFILNEFELVQRVWDMGYECVLLPLEEMTLYEQMRELRSLDVLIGIHGSALDNSAFMHAGGVMVQLLPYKMDYRCTFRGSAESAGVKYMEWQLKDITKTVFHWDLLEQANKDRLRGISKEEYISRGQIKADNRETLMFWINQV